MKRKIIAAAISALGFWSVPASSAPISHTLSINATVDAGCTIGTPSGSGFAVNGNSSTFATAVTGTSQAPASGTLTFGTLVCTTNGVKVTLSSARLGLYVDGTQDNSLAKRMNYVATAKLNAIPLATLDTKQGVASQTGQASLSGSSNTIAISISFPHSGADLLPNGSLTAGTYKDTITINIDGVTI